jgi:hypothetical protein
MAWYSLQDGVVFPTGWRGIPYSMAWYSLQDGVVFPNCPLTYFISSFFTVTFLFLTASTLEIKI